MYIIIVKYCSSEICLHKLIVKISNCVSHKHLHNYFIYPATCGGRITAANGIITSPNFPAAYSNNLDCEWIIAGPVGHFLRINVTHADLQYSTNCTADVLEIRDGNSTGTVLFRDCGWLPHMSVDTSDSLAHIRFRSDAFVTESGFYLFFQASAEGMSVSVIILCTCDMM